MDDVVETGEAAMKRWEESRDCVLQASGMISVQAGCSPDEALAMMRDRSHVQRQNIVAIAKAVVAREMRFG